jgi:hypothetical protein
MDGAWARESPSTEAHCIARLGSENRWARLPIAEVCGATMVRMHPIAPNSNDGVLVDAK